MSQQTYLTQFSTSELYRAYSNLQDIHVSSQEAESKMAAFLKNHICDVEPQEMVYKAILTQCSAILLRQEKDLSHDGSVPPSVEKHIAKLIEEIKVYRSTIWFISETNQLEATVQSVTDGS